MKDKLKIAIYSGLYPDTTFLTLLTRKLAKQNLEIQIYGNLNYKNKEDRGIKFYTFSSNNKLMILAFLSKYLFLNLLFNYKKLILFYKSVAKDSFYQKYRKALTILPIIYHKPDIIHLQWLKSYQLFNNLNSIITSKIIISLRGHQLSISSFIYDNFKNNTINAAIRADKIHSISDDLTKQLLAIVPSVEKKIVKINPAIDLDLFSITEEKVDRNKHSTLKLVTVCRLSWKKGLIYAIKALKLIDEKGINFEYNIIGNGEQYEELSFFINELNLTNKIKLLGRQTQNEIRNHLINADVFILPSIQEGFSNAVIEAQALGLPCLVSDAEGLEENIENGKTGFVFKKRDSEAIALLIEKFEKMPSFEYVKMRKNSVERCKNKYDVNNQVKQFKNLYLNV